MARPSKFKIEFIEQAGKLANLGATDRDVADFFNVSEATVYRWKHTSSEFCEALKVGKGSADDRVEQSLYRKAVGYSYDSEKVFNASGTVLRAPVVEHVPPDTTAAIFWLKNRRPEEWRDRHQVEVGKPGDFERMTDDELARFVAREIADLGIGPAGDAAASGKGGVRGEPKRVH